MNKQKLILLSAAATIPIAILLRKTQAKQKNRRFWSRSWLSRRQEGRGVLNMLEKELKTDDPEHYKSFVRMCGDQFDEILSVIQVHIERSDTNMRESISAEKRLAVTLRFLATGETYRSLMYATRIHESTISLIVPEVCKCINNLLLKKYIKIPQTSEEWEIVASSFEDKWNFPHCLGAIDGKHINFRAPHTAGSYYYNYKHNHSIVLLGLVDADYKFLYIDVGVNGRISDGGVYRESSLKKAIDMNILNFPPNKCFSSQDISVPYVFVTDDDFPLTNYRLSRARRVKNSFGLLTNRFRILLNTINLSPDKVQSIVITCCILHNFLLGKNMLNFEMYENYNLPQLVEAQAGNCVTEYTLSVINKYAHYFYTDDAVPWQNKCLA